MKLVLKLLGLSNGAEPPDAHRESGETPLMSTKHCSSVSKQQATKTGGKKASSGKEAPTDIYSPWTAWELGWQKAYSKENRVSIEIAGFQ